MFSLLLTFLVASGCTSDSTDDGGGTGGSSGAGGKASLPGGHAGTSSGGQGGGSDVTVGRNDDVAKHACDAWAGKLSASVSAKTINAVETSDYAELAEAKLTVNGATLYTINLPQNKESWVAVDENFWTATLGFFAPKGVKYEVINSDISPESDGPLKNGACPDAELTDYRVFFMHWTPATIHFFAEGPRQVQFMIMRDEANSIPVPPM
ncbi:MAG: hypothetical protein SF187_05515 [Deltaproteobacteria bacterium]|nr:hypothetical protein [Deltaproteobacteria bacterium]